MKGFAILIIFCTAIMGEGYGQDTLRKWDLKNCIDYALEHNIQIKKSKISLEESREIPFRRNRNYFLPSLFPPDMTW